MRSLQDKLILLAASASFVLLCTLLRGRPFSIETALCVSYTFLFLGFAVRGRGFRNIVTGASKPVLSLLLAHSISLIVLLALFEISNAAAPLLPSQFTQPLSILHSGPPGPPVFRIAEIMCIGFLCWLEVRWFRSGPPVAEEDHSSGISFLNQEDQEFERMKRLRLH